jgi:hypothetical protein
MAKRTIQYLPSLPHLTPQQVENYREAFVAICPMPDSLYWDDNQLRFRELPYNSKHVAVKYQYLFVGFILGQRRADQPIEGEGPRLFEQ